LLLLLVLLVLVLLVLLVLMLLLLVLLVLLVHFRVPYVRAFAFAGHEGGLCRETGRGFGEGAGGRC